MASKTLVEELAEFVQERDWSQFHTPENLAKSIVIEASELLECFQWNPNGNIEDIKDELADVLTYCYLLAKKFDLSPERIVLDKLNITRAKYPIELSKGRSTKYDRLQD